MLADFSSWGFDLLPVALLDVGVKLLAFRNPI